MKGKCSLPDCGLKDGLTCELGHRVLEECPHFKTVPDEAAEQVSGVLADIGSGQRLPWTGRAFGLSDMMLVSARSPSSLVGLIGPFDAGKTTFLTALFVHFSKTGIVENHSFAGSYTIDTWAHLKQYTEWPAANGPSFPPHTHDTGERVPSLLHLAFREGDGLVQDLIFTDAPGEWFKRWVLNQAAEEARGARWIADHATHFLFFIDRSALAGSEVGKSRQDTLALARLLAENRRNRPIAAIWSKSNGLCDETIEKPIRERLDQLFGPHESWNLDAENPSCLKVLSHLLSRTEPTAALQIPSTTTKSSSAFMSFVGTSI